MISKLLMALPLPAAVAAILFGAAGASRIPRFWAYVGLLLALNMIATWLVDPGLARERLHPGPGEQDRLTRLVIAPLVGSHWLIAGADVGWAAWSAAVPPALRMIGFAAVAAAGAMIIWTAQTNPFFSSAVRIQADRGQHVIDQGPYRLVRHPGYAAMAVAGVASSLALGSLASLVPIVPGIALMVRRIALEERLLARDLAGYAGYAGRVRFRLIPGVW